MPRSWFLVLGPIGLALAQHQTGAAEWKAMGLARAAEGNMQGALECFDKACRLAPRDPDACYYLGRNLFVLNRNREASEAFEKALQAAPRPFRWTVHRAVARNFEVLSRAVEAERHFRESIRLRPGDAAGEDPRIDYGAFLFRMGRAPEALTVLERAVEASPSSGRAHAESGRVLLDLGRVPEAAVRLQRALQLNPKDWAAHLLLGRVWYRLGRVQDGDRETQIGHEGLSQTPQGSSTVK